ncbi:DUF4352 domain-containing protein [Haloechinothrix salitolerans]|uniref:DUF4352 domain-containing protein n=1 Tax=Haloechinothrix salitolerans TaxID=926830 RepID=A0ABW2BVD5_9PSEU
MPPLPAEQEPPLTADRRRPLWGVASVAIGWLSVVWALAGATLILTLPLALTAIGCGVRARTHPRRYRAAGLRSPSTVGMTLGVLALLSGLLTDTDSPEPTNASSDAASGQTILGEPVRMGGMRVTVTDVSAAPEKLQPTSGQYWIVRYRLSNRTSSTGAFDKTAQLVYADSGQRYAASTQGTLELTDATMLHTLEPGDTSRSKIVFALPEAATVAKLGLVSSIGSEHVVEVP